MTQITVMVCQSRPTLKTKQKWKVVEDKIGVIFLVLPDFVVHAAIK